MGKRAIILAGGRGTRLRPYTVVLPKPLMPIGEYPILEVVIRQLARCGFDHITLAVNHQAELIKAFFDDGRKWRVRIDYSLEDRPLATMGPLRLVRDLPENFLVMNGDILTDLDFGAFHDEHVAKASLFTISAHRREQRIDYGVLESNGEGELVAFREKPRTQYEVSMGVYMASRAILDFIPPEQAYGFDNLMLDLIAAGRKVAVRNYPGYWLDIGRPDDYAEAIEQFDAMQSKFLDG
ncbi:MAG: Nucleotidyl transferase [Devosia sp.]|uniref:nucleotidyltransferase family protein n=1 Tax=Devosia sp. TaxID=1871048 RepID=UPI002627C53A|nr:nucleotidyltransferase family protein [Devosia sp.]MDB5526954.1 Nucleotidyl transferase [Devosia sp.]